MRPVQTYWHARLGVSRVTASRFVSVVVSSWGTVRKSHFAFGPNVAVKVESRLPARFTLRPYGQAGSSLCSNSAITPFEYGSKECTASLPTQRFEPIPEVNMPDQLNKSVQAFHAGFSRSWRLRAPRMILVRRL